ncbi:Elongator complex protein 4 [Coprinopsis sp. MPI-PUGE-AT-0042]|nr:Elongator complex protein 4 [Coprinopsis sp. MPI-PUGE-AT-0042]
MSSFKRKNPAKVKATSHTGTRVSAASSSTVNVSTGISSLDDLLGGGLPLSCTLVVAAPDLHSSYGQLIQKYYASEGLASGHHVCVIDSDPEAFIQDAMWYPKSMLQQKEDLKAVATDEEEDGPSNEKVKIAWRYEQMKQFQTTVNDQTSDDFCHVFDLTNRLPQSVVDEARSSGKLSFVEPDPSLAAPFIATATKRIETLLKNDSSLPIRLCIPSLGSPLCWGDLKSQDILSFLNRLRSLLRAYPHASASITLAPQLSEDQWGGPGWLHKVGWVADAAISMAAFSADLALSSIFPSHHGIVRLLSLPAPTTLVPPSDRFSILRGLSSSSSVFGGSGENNLAFKCTRKRLIFETLHLDLEGGVSERRTTAPSSATTTETGLPATKSIGNQRISGAKIDIELEGAQMPIVAPSDPEAGNATISTPESSSKPKREKKKVAFFSERPDVYDY